MALGTGSSRQAHRHALPSTRLLATAFLVAFTASLGLGIAPAEAANPPVVRGDASSVHGAAWATNSEVPGPVSNLRMRVRGNEIAISWGKPVLDDETVITGYQYRVDGRPWTPAQGTAVTLSDLAWGRSVRVDVRAINDFGPGESTSAWGTPLKYQTGPPDMNLPTCGKHVASGRFPTPAYGLTCRLPVTLEAKLIVGDNNVTFSRYDVRKRYWDYRIQGPSRDWEVVGTLDERLRSGRWSELESWYDDNSDMGYVKYHAYAYPYRLGPGNYRIQQEFWIKWTTEYSWIQTGEATGEYVGTRSTRLSDKETLYFSIY